LSETKLVLLERLENGVAKLTLNGPPLNLITVSVNQQMNQALDELGNDDSVRVVVITGSGEKAFCAGADIKEFARFVESGTMISEKLKLECYVFDKLANLPQPTIAALNGITLGSGLEIALCCDYIIMADHIKVGFPEIKIGLFPGSGGLVRVPKIVGKAKAKELMFFGDMLTAKEALELGMVNEVMPAGEVLARAYQRANQLAELPRQSLRAIKRGINDVYEMPDPQGIQYSLGLISRVLSSDDAKEGVNAFINKRKPNFNQHGF